MVDISQLRALRAVSETGSITAAAQQTGMSQPGLSRLIERVESEIGAQLFERGRSGAVPTDAGRKVLEFALNTITSFDALTASLGVNSRATGAVNVASSTTPGEYLLPKFVADFNAIHNDVSVESLVMDSASVARRVLAREADVGFCGVRPGCPQLRCVAVACDEVVLAVPASHEFASRGEIQPCELAQHRLLRRERGSGTYETVSRALASVSLSLPESQASMTLGSAQAVLSAVDSGLGIGFVTTRALEFHRPARVAAVRLAGIPLTRELYFIYEIARPRSRQAQAFIDFVERKALAYADE
jgi:DNA-binding transcriptional LysR family regulator